MTTLTRGMPALYARMHDRGFLWPHVRGACT
eukprot:CAMPEP_0119381504 /NCGR_PEP_ID=MMETSP1334-20130426/65126_1 /TAXON_ID=127549 /ORGANISM="Calcidiscus leptoporus, Strain RCC1130" /LENGTH=30 /DNA_ID= /DNA_START= /DNA_END= /DNA_ORIENTATION=